MSYVYCVTIETVVDGEPHIEPQPTRVLRAEPLVITLIVVDTGGDVIMTGPGWRVNGQVELWDDMRSGRQSDRYRELVRSAATAILPRLRVRLLSVMTPKIVMIAGVRALGG